jgi:DNA-binding NarL/FixJ family response regulator
VKEAIPRVVVEECLASVPAVRDILNNRSMRFLFSVRSRACLMADDADIVLAAVGQDDDASVEELFSACPSASRPRVILVTSATSKVFHEEAIIRGACGILDASAPEVFVLKALACVARGELWLDRQTTGRVFDRLSRGMIRKKLRLSVVAVC